MGLFEGPMPEDLMPLEPESDAIDYSNPRHVPGRPGILTAVGVIDFIVTLFAVLLNAAAILLCFFLYRMTLPPPPPAPVLPLAPAVMLTPYHGDYLPANGMPQAERAAVGKSVSLNPDRQAMLDRLLAECGRKILNNGSTSLPPPSSEPTANNWQIPDVFVLPTGRIEIDNRTATFQPADGTAKIVVNGNFVTINGKTEFCAVPIDEAVDQIQRNLGSSMNALQAAALVDLFRPDGAGQSPQYIFSTPAIREVSKLENCQTIQFNNYKGGAWIISTGAVVFSPYTRPISLDAATGLPHVQQYPPHRSRKPLTLDLSLIVAMAVEYLCSIGVAVLLFIAGVRLLSDGSDAPQLHGGYALLKIALAIANLVIGLLANQQLVDGGFFPEVKWDVLSIGLAMQTIYPCALWIIFSTATARDYYNQRGSNGEMVPRSWITFAARFSPDAWGRITSMIAVLLGLMILGSDYFRWTHTAGEQLSRSYLFYPTVLGGAVLLIGGAAGIFRRRAVAVAVLSGALLLMPVPARADVSTSGIQQMVDQACAADAPSKGALFRKLQTQPDAFLPLLDAGLHSPDSYNRTLAKQTLRNWCQRHRLPDSPAAKDAIQSAITDLLANIHRAAFGNDDVDAVLVNTLGNTSIIVPLVEPWLKESRPAYGYWALDLISDAKPDDDQKWNALVAGVDDPRSRSFAQQVLGRYAGDDYQQRLELMIKNDRVPESRSIALKCLQKSFHGSAMSSSAQAAVTAAMDDPDPGVRQTATTLLGQKTVGGEKKLAALLHSPRLDQRQAAANALAFDPYDVRTVPVILPALHDKDPAVRAAAAAALIRSEFLDAKGIPVPDFLALLDDPDPQVRFQDASAIRQCQPASEALGPHTYPLLFKALLEGTNNGRQYRVLTDGPEKVVDQPVDISPVDYVDADPLTGEPVAIASVAASSSAESVLPAMAWWVSAMAWPVLLCLVIGVAAKAKV
jgi:hypothetical protein